MKNSFEYLRHKFRALSFELWLRPEKPGFSVPGGDVLLTQKSKVKNQNCGIPHLKFLSAGWLFYNIFPAPITPAPIFGSSLIGAGLTPQHLPCKCWVCAALRLLRLYPFRIQVRFFTFVSQQELLILIEENFVLIAWYHYVPACLAADVVSQCL